MAARTRMWVWCASVALVLMVSMQGAAVVAQGRSPVIDDPDRLFGDGTAVRAAAQRLADEGATVVVIAVRNAGRDTAAAQGYLNRRLNELGIASSFSSLRGSQIVFFLAPEPGYHGIFYVAAYRSRLDPVYRTIATSTMQPKFTEGRYSEGMVDGIDAIRITINPPPSRAIPITLGVVALLAVAAVVTPIFLRRRNAASALASARKRMEQARQTAGVAIADLGRRVREAQEQAKFDRVSYRPADVQRIATVQRRGEDLFAQAQAAFDAADDSTIGVTPAVDTYRLGAERYEEAARLAQEAAGPLGEAESLRRSLDRPQQV